MLFDYDGTLTPIAARPEIATLPEKTRHSLAALNEMDRFVVGVVSGRGLDDLVAMVGIPGLVYAGNHGLEISGGSMHFVHPETPDLESDLAGVSRLLQRELAGVPGILVENKRLTLTVHFRASPESYATQVDETVVATAAPYVATGKMKITRGKNVVEVRPNLDWGKGNAIDRILEDCGDNPLSMFFGDDETDEDGFVAVQNAGGLAIYVGPPRQHTRALHQLESPAEVGQMLALLVRLAEPDEQ